MHIGEVLNGIQTIRAIEGKASSSIEPSMMLPLQQKLVFQQTAENPWSDQKAVLYI